MSLATEVRTGTRPRLRTYVVGFDEAIGGGVPKGYVVLLNGAPGTMKSSLAFSIAYYNALHGGERSAYVTLEQGREFLLEHMAHLGLTDANALRNVVISDMGTVRKNLQYVQGKSSWLDLFKLYVQNTVRTENMSTLVIDSLDVLEAIARPEDRRTQLFHLFEWFRGLGLTTILVSERALPFAADRETPEEAFLADGILTLSVHETNDVYVQRRIRCVKLRATKHDPGYYALLFDEGRFEVTGAVAGAL